MIKTLIELIEDKKCSLTPAEIRHHLDPLPFKSQIQILDELHGHIYSMDGHINSIKEIELKMYLSMLIKKIKASYRVPAKIDSAEAHAQKKYDVMFNPCDKVLFETALAGAILENKPVFALSVNKVASHIAHILSQTLFNEDVMRTIPNSALVSANLLKHINSMISCDYYNRYKKRELRTPISKAELPDFQSWAIETLMSPRDDNLDQKMFLIYVYTGFVSRPDRMGCATVNDAPDALFMTKETKSVVMETLNKHKYTGKPGAFNAKGRSVSRRNRKSVGGTPLVSTEETNPPHNIAGIVPGKGVRGSAPVDTSALPQEIVRLLELANLNMKRSSSGLFQPSYVPEEGVPRTEQHFYDEAFYQYKLPLVGGASGGAGTFEIAMALTKGLSKDDIRKIRLLTMALFISLGFHSLHEVCYIQKLCGSDYVVGDYKSVMHPDLMGEENHRLIMKEFAHLLGLPFMESKLLKAEDSKNIRTIKKRTVSLPLEKRWSPMHFSVEAPSHGPIESGAPEGLIKSTKQEDPPKNSKLKEGAAEGEERASSFSVKL